MSRVLKQVNKKAECYFDRLIGSFVGAICLGVVSHTVKQLHHYLLEE